MMNDRHYSRATIAQIVEQLGLSTAMIHYYIEVGLLEEPFTEADIAELRRIRRLQEDLELDMTGVEVALRMRRRMLWMQAELARLEAEVVHMADVLKIFRQMLKPSYPRLPAMNEVRE